MPEISRVQLREYFYTPLNGKQYSNLDTYSFWDCQELVEVFQSDRTDSEKIQAFEDHSRRLTDINALGPNGETVLEFMIQHLDYDKIINDKEELQFLKTLQELGYNFNLLNQKRESVFNFLESLYPKVQRRSEVVRSNIYDSSYKTSDQIRLIVSYLLELGLEPFESLEFYKTSSGLQNLLPEGYYSAFHFSRLVTDAHVKKLNENYKQSISSEFAASKKLYILTQKFKSSSAVKLFEEIENLKEDELTSNLKKIKETIFNTLDGFRYVRPYSVNDDYGIEPLFESALTECENQNTFHQFLENISSIKLPNSSVADHFLCSLSQAQSEILNTYSRKETSNINNIEDNLRIFFEFIEKNPSPNPLFYYTLQFFLKLLKLESKTAGKNFKILLDKYPLEKITPDLFKEMEQANLQEVVNQIGFSSTIFEFMVKSLEEIAKLARLDSDEVDSLNTRLQKLKTFSDPFCAISLFDDEDHDDYDYEYDDEPPALFSTALFLNATELQARFESELDYCNYLLDQGFIKAEEYEPLAEQLEVLNKLKKHLIPFIEQRRYLPIISLLKKVPEKLKVDFLDEALFKAVEVGNIFIIKLLVDQGANINTKNKQDQSLLCWALENKIQPWIIDSLIDLGANVSGEKEKAKALAEKSENQNLVRLIQNSIREQELNCSERYAPNSGYDSDFY